MKKKYLLLIIAAVVAVLAVFIFSSTSESEGILTEVSEGEFVISVSTSGELDSKNSTEIQGPTGMRGLGIYENMKLTTIIEEGTVVDSGDFIASIDPTPVMSKMKDVDANLEKLTAIISQAKLDSALSLRADRDNLVNLKYNIEELEVEIANSTYESPITQEKLKISLQKARRQYDQSLNNYYLKKKKEENTVRTSVIDYQKELDKKSRYIDVLKEFNIKAPQDGMLIYAKTWSGRKITSGSEISLWDPTVAKLPDLSAMIVKTYVNEVDISQVKEGQVVEIGVDAFPDKKLKGIVTSVANIGEEMKNTSAHVFEVVIEVLEQDDDLRPAMTTKNTIIVETLDSVLFIPIECINTIDSVSFVYSKGNRVEVEAGVTNQDEIIIKRGLKKGDPVYLVPPADAEKWKLIRL